MRVDEEILSFLLIDLPAQVPYLGRSDRFFICLSYGELEANDVMYGLAWFKLT